MRATITRTFIAAFLFSTLAISAFAQGSIAIVDMNKVFDKYYKTVSATESLKQRGGELDKELSALSSQHQKAAEDYKTALEAANNMVVSSTEREKSKKVAETKLREIQDLEQSIRQFQAQASTTMEEQTRRMRENIVTEIRTVVTGMAKKAGYALVLDSAGKSASGVPIVLYNQGLNDLTDAILAQLNANAPAGTSASGNR